MASAKCCKLAHVHSVVRFVLLDLTVFLYINSKSINSEKNSFKKVFPVKLSSLQYLAMVNCKHCICFCNFCLLSAPCLTLASQLPDLYITRLNGSGFGGPTDKTALSSNHLKQHLTNFHLEATFLLCTFYCTITLPQLIPSAINISKVLLETFYMKPQTLLYNATKYSTQRRI